MTDEEIVDVVTETYKRTYSDITSIRVTQIVRDTFNGHLVVVAFKEKGDQDETEEMCFVFDNKKVQVFESTEQLSIFLDSRVKYPWYQRVFGTATLSGIVFMSSIVFVFIAGFFDWYDDKALALLGTVVGAAAGFYFGSSKSK